MCQVMIFNFIILIYYTFFVKSTSRNFREIDFTEKKYNCFRYVIGGQFLNIFTEFYLNTSTYNDLTPTNPKWVGAWWLGFLLIFVLSMICGLMICIFPAKLCDNNADDENDKNEKQNVSEQQQDDNENVLNTNKLDIGKLQDIPKALLRLVKNATWMCITFGGTMDGFILAGNEIVMIYKDKSCFVVFFMN